METMDVIIQGMCGGNCNIERVKICSPSLECLDYAKDTKCSRKRNNVWKYAQYQSLVKGQSQKMFFVKFFKIM
jgi:hypothetical protein